MSNNKNLILIYRMSHGKVLMRLVQSHTQQALCQRAKQVGHVLLILYILLQHHYQPVSRFYHYS